MSKFYQLEPDEWLAVCKELKPAELKVLYRLRTIDPYGQHPIKFRVVDLAKDLDMNKGTISRAMQRLADLGYINLEIVEAIATLTTKSKRLSTDNQVVYRQLNQQNIGCLQTTKLSVDNLGDRYTTSAIATQPDSPQISSGQGTDLPKIYLEDLKRSDRSNDFDFSEKSQFPKHLEAIASCTDEAIQNCDLKAVEKSEDAKSPVKAIAPVGVDSRRREIENFVISKRALEFSNDERRKGYFDKFSVDDWDNWESQMKPKVSKPIDSRDPVAEDPWRVENAIASMVRCKDFEAAENRLSIVAKNNPTLASQFREKYLCS